MIPLTIVSGFPRSGTSAMMRMLHLGGMEILAHERTMERMNDFTPHGDFELHGKELRGLKDTKPENTAGRVIKIVSPFVREFCPTDRPIRVIFMLRDTNEIVASLLAMKVVWEWEPSESIADARGFFEENSIPVKYIKYADLVTYPLATANIVSDWLGIELDFEKAITAVDKNPRKDVKSNLVQYQPTAKVLVDDTFIVDLKKEESQ